MQKKDREKSKVGSKSQSKLRVKRRLVTPTAPTTCTVPVTPAEKHYTYILKCADNTLYIGATNNLEKRLVQHNTSKQGAHYTKIRRPVLLAYSETFATLSESRKREAELKRLSRSEKLKLVGATD